MLGVLVGTWYVQATAVFETEEDQPVSTETSSSESDSEEEKEVKVGLKTLLIMATGYGTIYNGGGWTGHCGKLISCM